MDSTTTTTDVQTYCTRCGLPTYKAPEPHGLQHGIPGVWHRRNCSYPHGLSRATHEDNPQPPQFTDEQADAIRRNVR